MTGTRGARPFDAVLCDVDNVIRFYDASEVTRLERAAGLAEGTTMKVAFAPEADLPLMLGRIDMRDWVSVVVAGFDGSVPEPLAYKLAQALADAPFHADPTVVSLLRRVRDVVPLVLVTNAAVTLEADLETLGLTGLAHHVVSSARVRLVKPDPRIYRIAADRAGVPPQRCLFVDDSPENVSAAAGLGMRTAHFTEPADLARALAPLL
ncbi:HAD family hydrolase [Streptomyces sp. NPDC088387]|uniref:HAD family hydrolase n=1 Tax=Streptomyces sp. NPDC088387 TaxID=3365859 RepID=UPI0037FBBDFD